MLTYTKHIESSRLMKKKSDLTRFIQLLTHLENIAQEKLRISIIVDQTAINEFNYSTQIIFRSKESIKKLLVAPNPLNFTKLILNQEIQLEGDLIIFFKTLIEFKNNMTLSTKQKVILLFKLLTI